MLVLSTAEAQLSLYEHNIRERAPEARECQETGGQLAEVTKLR